MQVQHDQEIDWLELNQKGTHLLFRDHSCRLHLYDIAAGTRKQLLLYVGYVQWVPDSDVIVVCFIAPLPLEETWKNLQRAHAAHEQCLGWTLVQQEIHGWKRIACLALISGFSRPFFCHVQNSRCTSRWYSWAHRACRSPTVFKTELLLG
jgi:hypothetical protein